MRVSTSLSPTARAVVVQGFARDDPAGPMVAVGRPFIVFRAELNAVAAALAEAGAALDAVVA